MIVQLWSFTVAAYNFGPLVRYSRTAQTLPDWSRRGKTTHDTRILFYIKIFRIKCSTRTRYSFSWKVTQLHEITQRKPKGKMIAKKYVLYPPACWQNHQLYQHICYNEVACWSFDYKIFEKKIVTNYHNYRITEEIR